MYSDWFHEYKYFEGDGSMEKKYDTGIAAD
jgi:hypothetical protein